MTLLPDTPLFPTGQDHYKDWQGLSDGSLAAVLAEVARTADGPLLVAAPDSSRAQQLADALGFYLAGNPGAAGEVPVMLFPDWETLPYDLFSPHQDIVSDRIRVLNWLHGAGTGVLVVPVNTLMQRIAPPLHISGNSFMLRVGETFDMETTRARLVDCGYRQRDNVYEHGEFAVRGAIMDVFPMGSEQPFRVELFDEDIESLRLFEAQQLAAEDLWIEKLDLAGFAEEIRALGKELEAGQGPADAAHLRKLMMWTDACRTLSRYVNACRYAIGCWKK